MSGGIFNIAKGAIAEKFRDSAAAGIMLLLKANETESTLVDHDDLNALLGAAGNTEADFTNYVRKTGLTGTVTVDDTNDRVDVDIPDQTWSSAGGTTDNTLTKAVIAYQESAADTGRIPCSHHDFAVTTDGTDLTSVMNAAGFYRGWDGGVSIFPLAINSGGRYLEDAQGNPQFLHGDTPWNIIIQCTTSQIDTYLDDRESKGFTALYIGLIEYFYSSQTPAYRTVGSPGYDPFGTMGNPPDWTDPVENYWIKADYVYEGCISRGIVPIFNPAYFGGGSDGWDTELGNSSDGDLQDYGTFLAQRYPYALWCAGGDAIWDSTLRDKQGQIFDAIATENPNAIITAHSNRQSTPGTGAYTYWSGYSWFNLNNIYTDRSTEYDYAASEYARSGPVPFILLEGGFENEPVGSPISYQALRRQFYTPILSGAKGHIGGDRPLWGFGEPQANAGAGPADALTYLSSTYYTQLGYGLALFSAYNWHLLEPKTDTSLVTTSLGSGGSRICPALASDGSVAMIWTIGDNFTVDMSVFSSNRRARWFDTTDGSYTLDTASISNSGTHDFTVPDSNDWVLVLDAA